MAAGKFKGVRRVGIIFSGGPAPAANAVISACTVSFLEDNREVIGFFHGYSALQEYHPVSHRLLPDVHYRSFSHKDMRGQRNARGVLIGTSRSNPGKGIKCAEDLKDPVKTERLRRVYSALIDLEIDALVSIGGDDTLKTANFLFEFQKHLPPEAPRVSIVHVPKTIDNDYEGIDFTFGFFTAVDTMAKELQNLRADAMATSSYFIVETMGRKAGWLAYGVGIAGESDLIISVEDLKSGLTSVFTTVDPESGEERVEEWLDMDRLVDRIVDLIITREDRHGEYYGTVVLAEGLAEQLPRDYLRNIARDEHGHISLGNIDLGKLVASLVEARYTERTDEIRKVKGVQLGYESRCSPPHAFDVMMASQLGIGAYRALVEDGVSGKMISVAGQLDLHYVPFGDLINPDTMLTKVRYIEVGSDFHRLARFLETRSDTAGFTPGPRLETGEFPMIADE